MVYIRAGSYIMSCIAYLSYNTSSIEDRCTVTQVNLKLVPIDRRIHREILMFRLSKQDWSGQCTAFIVQYGNSCMITACPAQRTILSGETPRTLATIRQYSSGNLSTAWVSKTGTTYYSIRSSLDYAGTDPGSQLIMLISMYRHPCHRILPPCPGRRLLSRRSRKPLLCLCTTVIIPIP